MTLDLSPESLLQAFDTHEDLPIDLRNALRAELRRQKAKADASPQSMAAIRGVAAALTTHPILWLTLREQEALELTARAMANYLALRQARLVAEANSPSLESTN